MKADVRQIPIRRPGRLAAAQWPEATVIFDNGEELATDKVLRVTRNGRDSCLARFFQLFEHPDTAISHTLQHHVAFYSGYGRLMTHWERVYAGKIYRV